MSELSYKELQEQGVFDVPYRAFEYMQSQQAKIDCMQVRLDGADERALSILNHKNVMVDKMQAEIDELQGRIDEALHAADESCGVSIAAFVKLNKILKGNKDEN